MTRRAHPAAEKPCDACPWRIANQGKRKPRAWYSLSNLRRLWSGLRDGERMTCHPTDPDNPLPPGARALPEDVKTRECTGALIVVQREVTKFQECAAQAEAAGKRDGFGRYQKMQPCGMTIGGILATAERALFGGTVLGGTKMTLPNLNDDEIGAPWLSWEDRR